MTDLTATNITLGDIGRQVMSISYRSKNKTERPLARRTYRIDSIYAHENGNILINGSVYLHHDTPIVFVSL